MEFICLDIESTGLDCTQDEIIEVAAVKFNETEILGNFQTFIRYEKPIPEIVEHLTGITLEMTKSAPTLESKKQAILDFCGDLPIVGHNINFDIGFLKEKGIVLENTLFDTLPLSHILVKNIGSHSLEILCSKLNKQYFPSHRAEDDCLANIELFQYFLELIKNLPAQTNYFWTQILQKSPNQWSQILLSQLGTSHFANFEKPLYLTAQTSSNPNATPSIQKVNSDDLTNFIANADQQTLLVCSESLQKKITQDYTKIPDPFTQISLDKFAAYLEKDELTYQQTILLLKISEGLTHNNPLYTEQINLHYDDYQFLNELIEQEYNIPDSKKMYLVNHYTFFKLHKNNQLPQFKNIICEDLPFIQEQYVRANEKRINIANAENGTENLALHLIFRELNATADSIKSTQELDINEVAVIDNFNFVMPEIQNFLNQVVQQTNNQTLIEDIEHLKSNFSQYFIWISQDPDYLPYIGYILKDIDTDFSLEKVLSTVPAENITILNNASSLSSFIIKVPTSAPDPNDFSFSKYLQNKIFAELSDLTGQALIICPAKVLINELHKNLAKRFDEIGINLLTQDISGSKGKLLDNIENKEGPIVLLCTQYFYLKNKPAMQNVQKAIITKLPMSLPNHIYYEYKKTQVKNSFMELLVPNTANTIYEILSDLKATTPNLNELLMLDNRLTFKSWGIEISNNFPKNIIVQDCQ